jgi:TolB-like protein
MASFSRTPAASVPTGLGGEKIPLKVALIITPELESYVYNTEHTYQNSAKLDIHINVGKSSAELFRRGLAQVVAEAEELPLHSPWPDARYSLALIPVLTHASADSNKAGKAVRIEYKLEVLDRHGRRAVLESGIENASREFILSGATGSRTTNLVMALPYGLIGGSLVGMGTLEAGPYAEAFAQAEAQAFVKLVAKLRESPAVLKAVEEARQEAEWAQLALSQPRLDAQLSKLVTELLEGLAGSRPRRIAVTRFTPMDGAPTKVEAYLAEELLTRLAMAKPHTVVERALLDKALQEFNLNQADLVDPRHSQDLGRLTGADAVLVGNTVDLGHWIKVTARLVETETGTVLSAGSVSIFKHEQVKQLLKTAMQER